MLESRARLFATAAHGALDQKRKYTDEPYIHHPAAVVELVRSVPHSEEMLAAAWLHDVVEDTAIDFDTIEVEFGTEVVWLVRWMTDVSQPQDGNRAHRKALDLAHLALAPAPAQTIKVADLIDNTKSIVLHDPSFARVYLAEKHALLDVLTDANPALLKQARDMVAAGVDVLNAKLGGDMAKILRGEV